MVNYNQLTFREIMEFYIGYQNRLSKQSLIAASIRAGLVGGSVDDNDLFKEHRLFNNPQFKKKSVLKKGR